jgi:hypothetical protein
MSGPHKRPYGKINGQLSAPRPSKAAKLSLASKDDEIEELKAQIEELHEFIINEGLESSRCQAFKSKSSTRGLTPVSEAPPSIQHHIDNSAISAAKLDESIRTYINKAFVKQADGFCYAWSAGGRADEMSPPMAWIITEVKRLGEKTEGLDRAFNMMFYLSEIICATVEDRGAQYGFWSSDTPADDLLMSLASRLKEERKEFNPLQQSSALGWQINRLRALGIQTFFPRSYNLMQSWIEGPDAAPRLHDALKGQIFAAYSEIKDRIQKNNEKLNSDDYSKKMTEFIPHIQRLSTLSSVGLSLAFDLIIYLGQHSYGVLENGGRGAPNRPSDPEADDLLVEIATSIKNQDHGFAPVNEVNELKRRSKKLKKQAIRTFFPKSFDLMWPWLPGAATEYHDDLKKRITKGYKETGAKLFANNDYKDKRATSDWFSVKMAAFIPEIGRLSEINGGLLLAFGLLVLAGNSSYLRDERLDPFYGWGPVPPDWWGGRRSDPLADELMIVLVERIQEEQSHFRPVAEIAQLQDGAKFLSSHNIDSFFQKSLPLMASWIPETANPNGHYQSPYFPTV